MRGFGPLGAALLLTASHIVAGEIAGPPFAAGRSGSAAAATWRRTARAVVKLSFDLRQAGERELRFLRCRRGALPMILVPADAEPLVVDGSIDDALEVIRALRLALRLRPRVAGEHPAAPLS